MCWEIKQIVFFADFPSPPPPPLNFLQETLEPTSCSTTLATEIHDRNCTMSELVAVLPPSNNLE